MQWQIMYQTRQITNHPVRVLRPIVRVFHGGEEMTDKHENETATGYKRRMAEAFAALANGKGVLLVDDENRENEGDLVFCAARMTVSQMALMIRECSGIVCLCMEQDAADRLALAPMVAENTSRYQTAFTVSIEAADGVTTGVSAADRMTTIRAAISPWATPADLNRPEHVFPLVARENGVFARQGHTEGSVDLVKLVNLPPFAVLCELTNEDGTMARMPEIEVFSRRHGFPVVSIADIVAWRFAREKRERQSMPVLAA